METLSEEASASLPRILRYCKRCQEETPHQIDNGGLVVCLICVERALNYELDRD